MYDPFLQCKSKNDCSQLGFCDLQGSFDIQFSNFKIALSSFLDVFPGYLHICLETVILYDLCKNVCFYETI